MSHSTYSIVPLKVLDLLSGSEREKVKKLAGIFFVGVGILLTTILLWSQVLGSEYPCLERKSKPGNRKDPNFFCLCFADPPTVTLSIEPQTVQEGEHVIFTCQATANPEILGYRCKGLGALLGALPKSSEGHGENKTTNWGPGVQIHIPSVLPPPQVG